MRFKLAPELFWGLLIPSGILIVGSPVVFIYATIDTQDPRFLLFLLSPISVLIALYIGRIDYFSVITISEQGISVSCFGKIIFCGNWKSDIHHIGKFKIQHRYQTPKTATQYIFFSKTPISLVDKKIYRNDRPSTMRMQGQAVFLTLTPIAIDQIQKCIRADIRDYGLVAPMQ